MIDHLEPAALASWCVGTTPLKGAWSRPKGGYYHDGRFPTLRAVVEHHDRVFGLRLTETEMNDLVEYLKSL